MNYNNISESAKWIVKQICFKEEHIKNASGVVQLLLEKKRSKNNFELVKQIYLGFVKCSICNKKVDCMLWDGDEFYFENNLNKERSSPIHWCELTENFLLDDLTQIVVNMFERELEETRRMA